MMLRGPACWHMCDRLSHFTPQNYLHEIVFSDAMNCTRNKMKKNLHVGVHYQYV